MDIGVFLFKLRDHIDGVIVALGNVLAPVVNIQGHIFLTFAAAA